MAMATVPAVSPLPAFYGSPPSREPTLLYTTHLLVVL